MTDLNISYMGLNLRNPLIVGSSPLTSTAEKCKELEDAGAGAVVLKSIFEEQIRADVSETYDSLDGDIHPEAYQYLQADIPMMQLGPAKYLEIISRAKEMLSIPVIASVNCTTPDMWVDFAAKIENSGADALELNVYDIPSSIDITGAEIEARHIDLVKKVAASVNIPVAVKIGPFYSSIPAFAKALDNENIQAIVMFNRFFQPDINTDDISIKPSTNLSSSQDIRTPLRWIAITSDNLNCDISLTGGVHTAEDAIKAILAGANTFQVCSKILTIGPSAIKDILDGLNSWMEDKGYQTVNDFVGLLSNKHLHAEKGFERAQYIKALMG